MRTLVTGGAGFIGSHVVDALLAAGHEVTILDNLEPLVHPSGKPSWMPPDVRFVLGDIRDSFAVNRALEGVEIVFHLAAYGGFAPDLAKMVEANTVGTARLLEAIRAGHGHVRHLIVASSQAVYGEGLYHCATHGVRPGIPRSADQMARGDWEARCPDCAAPMAGAPTHEDAPILLTNTYAITKYSQEQLVLALGRQWQLPTTALRYALTFGPRQSVSNPYCGICSVFYTRFLNGRPPVIYEDGHQTRDFSFIEDVARAHLVVMNNPLAFDRAFNVGTGHGTSVAEFAQMVGEACGVGLTPMRTGGYRPADMRHLVTDNTRLRNLGWEPRVSVREGVRRYVEWAWTLGKVADRFGEVEPRLKELGIVRQSRPRRPAETQTEPGHG